MRCNPKERECGRRRRRRHNPPGNTHKALLQNISPCPSNIPSSLKSSPHTAPRSHNMVGPCVVCCSSRPPPEVLVEYKASRLGEEEAVSFFLRKFLKYPLLAEDEVVVGGGGKSFVSFCWSCLPVIQEAQSLYKIIAELEEKMSILRKRVERRVVLSFHSETNRRNSDESKRSVFSAVRNKIYMRNADTFKQDLESGGGVVLGGEVLIAKTGFSRQNSEYTGVGGGPQQQQQQQQQRIIPPATQVTAAWPVVDPLAFLQMSGHHHTSGDGVGLTGDHEQTFTVPMAGMGGGGSGATQYFPVVSVATISAGNSDGNSAWDAASGAAQQTIQIPSASHARSGGRSGGGFTQESSAVTSAATPTRGKSRKSQKTSNASGARRSGAANVSAPCNACGNSFSRKDSLARHQKLYCIKIPTSKAYQKMAKPKVEDDVGMGNSLSEKSSVFKTEGDTSYTSEEDLLYTPGDQESVPNY